MNARVLIDCPKCGRKMKIPSQAGAIHITCPSCWKQWDWDEGKLGANGFFSDLTERVRGSFRPFFAGGRLSYAHLSLALVAGIAIGVALDTKLHVPRKAQAEPAFIPTERLTGESAATNILTLAPIGPKNEDELPTDIQDLK
jgi:hypothetical protein